MNTDMNPENINPDSSDNLNADNEETQLMDTPDNPIAADVTTELPLAKDLEDAVAPDLDATADDSQTPRRPSGLKRKLVAGGVALAIVAALGIGLSLNHEAVNIPDNAPVASIVGKKDSKTYPASVTLTADGWSEGTASSPTRSSMPTASPPPRGISSRARRLPSTYRRVPTP